MPLTIKRAIATISLLGLVIFGGLQIMIFISPGEGWGGGYALAYSIVTVLPLAIISFFGFAIFGRDVITFAIKHAIAYSISFFGIALCGGLLIYFAVDPGNDWPQRMISILCVLFFVFPGFCLTYVSSKWLLRWANSYRNPSNGSEPTP